jgi:hypothetical protein
MDIKWGVAFCHGRNHEYIPRSFRQQRVNWICVDENPKTNPDVVGDVLNSGTLRRLGFGQYEVVLTVYCPTSTVAEIIGFLESARLLLKPGGVFYFDNLIRRLIRQSVRHRCLSEGFPGNERDQVIKMMERAYLEGDPEMQTWVQQQLESLRVMGGFSQAQVVPGNPSMAQFTV